MATESLIDADLAVPHAAAPGPGRELWRSFRENKGAVAGLVVIVVMAFAAVFATAVKEAYEADQ